MQEPARFDVVVRNTEPLLRVAEGSRRETAVWILRTIGGALLVTAALVLFLGMAEASDCILYTVPAALLFIVSAVLERFVSSKTRTIVIAVIAAVLAVLAIVFRKYTLNGFELLMNQIFEHSEATQSYIYSRFAVGAKGEEAPEACCRAAAALLSAFLGLLASIPAERFRTMTAAVLSSAVLLLFAYYGIVPAAAGIGLMAAALIIIFAEGRLSAFLPLLLAGGLIFSAVMVTAPGESIRVSRIDENLRDRIALGSVTLETDDIYSGESGFDIDENEDEESAAEEGLTEKDSSFAARVLPAIIGIILLLALGAGLILFRRRLLRKRAENRKDIESSDPKTAIAAIFPYAVKWLRSCGISRPDSPGLPFSELLPEVTAETSEAYAASFRRMNEVWKEAVYSEHPMTEDELKEMKEFLTDTVEMTRDRVSFTEKLRIKYRYAL